MPQIFDRVFFQKLLDKMNTGVYITDVETYEIVYMNSHLKKQFQVEEKPGQICWKVLQNNMDGPCPFCKINQLKEMDEDSVIVWKEHNTLTGNIYLNHDCLQMWNGRLYHIQSFSDITEQIELSIAANYDELTGILNRNAGKQQLEDMLQELSSKDYFTVALCDVNGLKWVNDTLGHLEGDRLLIFLSRHIFESLDKEDFIFRLSGDEFVVVFKNKTVVEADAAMQKILKDLDERKHKNGITYDVSFSYGLSCIHGGEHLSVSDVLSIADTQMYIQKREYHILMGKPNLARAFEKTSSSSIPYRRDDLFEAMCESLDDYPFIGNLKTGEFLYSSKMMMDFGLPGQLINDAANYWGKRIHPEDVETFLKSNQEIASGHSERHAVTYRVKDTKDNWVGLLCKGKLIRDAYGAPDLFLGVIRNLSKHGETLSQDNKNARLFQNYIDSSLFLTKERKHQNTSNEQPSLVDGKRLYEQLGKPYEEKFLNMVSSDLPCGILLLRNQKDYPIVYFNQALLDYSGYSLEEFKEKHHNYLDLILQEDRKSVVLEREEQLHQSGHYEVRYRMMSKDRKTIWIYERGKTIANENNRYIVCTIVDITQEMSFDQELRYITQHSSSGVFKAEMSEGFPLIYASDGYYRLHGYTRIQLHKELNDRTAPLVLEDDIQSVQEHIETCIKEHRKHLTLKYRIRKRNQEIAWLHVNATLITSQSGPMVMIGMVMDITQHKQLENKVQRAERLYSFAREQSKLSMWEYDINKRTIYQSEDTRGVQGFDMVIPNVPEYLIENKYYHEDFVEVAREAYQKLQDGAKKVSFICKTNIRDQIGAYWWERISYTVVKDDSEGRWAIGLSENISEWKESQQKIYDDACKQLSSIEDLLVCYQLDSVKNELLHVWTADFITPTEIALDKGSYEDVFHEIDAHIATSADHKRFAKGYDWEALSKHIQENTLPKDFEFRMQRSNGAIIWSVIQFRTIIAPENDHPILFLYIKDIDLRKKHELSFQQKVEIDEQSGFYQSFFAHSMIENLLEQQDSLHCALAMLFVDTDKFEDAKLTMVHKIISTHLPKNAIVTRENNKRYMLFFHDYNDYSTPMHVLYQILDDLQKAQCFAAVGLCYRRTPTMLFNQLSESASYALNTAIEKGNGSLRLYREVQQSNLLELRVEEDTHRIIDMNTPAQIHFAQSEIHKDMKCYELLHQRTSPCPFCRTNLSSNSSGRECFIPRLQKVLYVEESLDEASDGKSIRSITLTPTYLNGEDSLKQLRNQIENCWEAIETGADRKRTFSALLKTLTSYYGARRSLLLPANPALPDLTYLVEGYEAPPTCEDSQILKDSFNTNQRRYLIIEDESSLGYEALKAYYHQQIPLPCLVGTILENQQLQGILIIEAISKHLQSLQAMHSVCGFLRRSNAIFELENSYRYARSHDNITGLLNYDSYIRYANEINEDVLSTFGMIGLYITNFKQYNKTYGIKQGNLLLQGVSAILRSHFPEEHCFRLSGANLLVIYPDVSYDSFLERLQKIEDKIQASYGNQIILAQVWESNVISLETMHQQLQEKIKITAQSLQNTEANGIAASTMLQNIQNEMAKGSFLIHLQPKITTKDATICGAEALIRYQHKEKGIISPGVFLPLIERAGLIHHIDLFVLEEVCKQLATWLKQGNNVIPISLNYSRATILQPNILEKTIQISDRYQIPRSLLEIEITESISSIDNAALSQIVRDFRQAGFAISIDDFGAEYSNIYMLYALDISTLKFDRRIINDIYHDERAKTVVKHIIELCRQMQIITVAEGVETIEQAKVLQELNCDRMQGYYINKPLHCQEFSKLYIK